MKQNSYHPRAHSREILPRNIKSRSTRCKLLQVTSRHWHRSFKFTLLGQNWIQERPYHKWTRLPYYKSLHCFLPEPIGLTLAYWQQHPSMHRHRIPASAGVLCRSGTVLPFEASFWRKLSSTAFCPHLGWDSWTRTVTWAGHEKVVSTNST